jgi:hypothetical protein
MNFYKGTLSLLVLVFLTGCYLSLKQGNDRRAGVWLGLALVKPQFMLLAAAMLLGARRWQALAVLFAMGGVIAIGSAGILGWQIWWDYALFLLRVGDLLNLHGTVPTAMYNLRGILFLALGPDRAPLINLATSVAFLGAVVFAAILWVGHWQPQDPVFEVRVAFTSGTISFFKCCERSLTNNRLRWK